jgi:hypothetical protein
MFPISGNPPKGEQDSTPLKAKQGKEYKTHL